MPGKDRQRALARERAARQMARRAEEARRRRATRTAIAAVIAVVVVLGGGALVLTQFGLFSSSTKPSTTAKEQCKYLSTTDGSTPARKVSLPKSTGLPTSGTVQVTLKTDRGDIGLALNQSGTPCTTNSFLSLAKQGYFDKTQCHRLSIRNPFVLQCGDPTATGSGGPGYTFPDEDLAAIGGPDPTKQKLFTYPVGAVAMANSGPNTNGSQFFLVYGNSQLDPNYTLFGSITSGAATIAKVVKGNVIPSVDQQGQKDYQDGKPKLPIAINSVTIGKTTTDSPSPTSTSTAPAIATPPPPANSLGKSPAAKATPKSSSATKKPSAKAPVPKPASKKPASKKPAKK